MAYTKKTTGKIAWNLNTHGLHGPRWFHLRGNRKSDVSWRYDWEEMISAFTVKRPGDAPTGVQQGNSHATSNFQLLFGAFEPSRDLVGIPIPMSFERSKISKDRACTDNTQSLSLRLNIKMRPAFPPLRLRAMPAARGVGRGFTSL
jgi:hypothetical protein